MDRRIVLLISVPIVIAAAVLFYLRSIKFVPPLSAAEKDLASFAAGAVPAVSIRQPIVAVGLESPIKIAIAQSAQKKDYPATPLSQVAPVPAPGQSQKTPEPPSLQQASYVVSFILANGGSERAIINGIVVREGDMINGSRVEIIEKNRVLLRDKKESRWLKIE
ncbi:MAG: hypothetical protein HQL08_07935 [Nitrospirae bacterium]|nr:hypothetical protein [Nitrospirota bacterium]